MAKQKLKRGIILCIFIILMILIPYASAQEISVGEVRDKIIDAYILVEDAHSAGGNVSTVVDKLNQALTLLEDYDKQGDGSLLLKADELVDEAVSEIPGVKEAGERMVFWNNVSMGLGVLVLVSIVALTYLYLPKIFFQIWLNIRGRNSLHVRQTRAGRKSMIIDEEIWAVVLAIVVVISVFSISQFLLASRVVEPFSELGLLGENMKIGDYPTNLVVGDEAFFYIYVGNRMGKPMYYRVLVKLGDANTTVDPAPISPVYTFEKILLHNETWIFPVSIPMNEPAVNLRIIVELWIYNDTVDDFSYHGRWNQLWINVTSI